MFGTVTAVSCNPLHTLSKTNQESIRLLAGLGVRGDSHCGATVQHCSRVRQNPNKPNLRQVHLIYAERFEALGEAGFAVTPGQIGENITTRTVDLPGLPVGARLYLGETATIEITGLRKPCAQIDEFHTSFHSHFHYQVPSEAIGVGHMLA